MSTITKQATARLTFEMPLEFKKILKIEAIKQETTMQNYIVKTLVERIKKDSSVEKARILRRSARGENLNFGKNLVQAFADIKAHQKGKLKLKSGEELLKLL